MKQKAKSCFFYSTSDHYILNYAYNRGLIGICHYLQSYRPNLKQIS